MEENIQGNKIIFKCTGSRAGQGRNYEVMYNGSSYKVKYKKNLAKILRKQ